MFVVSDSLRGKVSGKGQHQLDQRDVELHSYLKGLDETDPHHPSSPASLYRLKNTHIRTQTNTQTHTHTHTI